MCIPNYDVLINNRFMIHEHKSHKDHLCKDNLSCGNNNIQSKKYKMTCKPKILLLLLFIIITKSKSYMTH